MQITIDELNAIQAPERTKTWNPISHSEIMHQVNMTLKEIGIEQPRQPRIDVNKSGTNAFVTHSITTSEERSLQIGWRNSIDKTFALGFTSGSMVIVCSNLVFSGSWMEFEKHYNSLELDRVAEMASGAVIATQAKAEKMAVWHDQMKSLTRTGRDADHLFMQMVRLGIVPGQRVLNLANAYDEEKGRYGESLYSIYNAATQTFRSLSLPSISQRSGPLNQMIKSDMICHKVYKEPEVIDV